MNSAIESWKSVTYVRRLRAYRSGSCCKGLLGSESIPSVLSVWNLHVACRRTDYSALVKETHRSSIYCKTTKENQEGNKN